MVRSRLWPPLGCQVSDANDAVGAMPMAVQLGAPKEPIKIFRVHWEGARLMEFDNMVRGGCWNRWYRLAAIDD